MGDSEQHDPHFPHCRRAWFPTVLRLFELLCDVADADSHPNWQFPAASTVLLLNVVFHESFGAAGSMMRANGARLRLSERTISESFSRLRRPPYLPTTPFLTRYVDGNYTDEVMSTVMSFCSPLMLRFVFSDMFRNMFRDGKWLFAGPSHLEAGLDIRNLEAGLDIRNRVFDSADRWMWCLLDGVRHDSGLAESAVQNMEFLFYEVMGGHYEYVLRRMFKSVPDYMETYVTFEWPLEILRCFGRMFRAVKPPLSEEFLVDYTIRCMIGINATTLADFVARCEIAECPFPTQYFIFRFKQEALERMSSDYIAEVVREIRDIDW